MRSKTTTANKRPFIGIAASLLFVGFLVASFVRATVKANRGLALFKLDDVFLALATVKTPSAKLCGLKI